MNSSIIKNNLLVIIASILLFVPFLGAVHLFDWDEINFAECAREMLVTGDYLSIKINFLPFWEKPPLFIWMQAISMNILGVNEFAARLPNAICGICTMLIIFNIGRKLYDNRFGFFWTLTFAGSFLPHFYFKSGIIDPWFNLFIFTGIYLFILFTNNSKENNSTNTKRLILSALLVGLAVMTKGPVGLLIFILCFLGYFVFKKFNTSIISFKQILIYGITVAIIGGLWFIIEIFRGRTDIITDFFNYQLRLLQTEDSGHGGPFYFHFVILLIGCFPSSILALRAFNKDGFDTPFQKHFKTWMIILLTVVLILFSIVKTKIIHYSSLCYFPISFLGAYSIYKIINKDFSWKLWMTYSITIIGIGIASLLTILPLINEYKEKIITSELIKDEFTRANLNADVHWSGYEWLIGAIFFTSILLALFFIIKKRYRKALITLFSISLITVNMASLLIAPKVEQYTQAAVIEFYKGIQAKDCYIETLGFKSYAYLFYSQTKEIQQRDEMLNDKKLNKPSYFVCKVTDAEEYSQQYPLLKELYRKNGFVFFERKNN